MNEITFGASVAKVQTLMDGGIRVTLDLPEDKTMVMAQLAECARFGAWLRIIATVEQKNDRESPTKLGKFHI